MGPLKRRKIRTSRQRTISNDMLLRKMSEVISLRERVAQAELTSNLFKPPLQSGEEDDRSAKGVNDAGA